MTDSLVKTLTLKRRVGEILTTLEVEVGSIEEKDVHVIAARICKKTYPGFYLAGYTCWGRRYYFVCKG